MLAQGKRRSTGQQLDEWADWVHNPCRLGGGSRRFRERCHNQKGPKSGRIGYITFSFLGGTPRFRVGDTIRSGPQVGGLAT